MDKYVLEDWPGPWEKWARGFCYRNQWRVTHILGDYDDCLSHCAISFVHCKNRYEATINDPKQFMYLYKVWVTSEFNTLAVRDRHIKQLKERISKAEPSIEADCQVAAKLTSASEELKQVVNVFLNAPKEVMDVLRADVKSCNPKRFFKEVVKFCNINQDRSADLAKELQDLLG